MMVMMEIMVDNGDGDGDGGDDGDDGVMMVMIVTMNSLPSADQKTADATSCKKHHEEHHHDTRKLHRSRSSIRSFFVMVIHAPEAKAFDS
jgi:hypothetical protein